MSNATNPHKKFLVKVEFETPGNHVIHGVLAKNAAKAVLITYSSEGLSSGPQQLKNAIEVSIG